MKSELRRDWEAQKALSERHAWTVRDGRFQRASVGDAVLVEGCETEAESLLALGQLHRDRITLVHEFVHFDGLQLMHGGICIHAAYDFEVGLEAEDPVMTADDQLVAARMMVGGDQ